MHNGNISNNLATSFAGGVQTSGNFTMLGGNISNNTANQYGGGVLVSGSGIFNMSGGEIIKNTVVSGNGGGVYALYGDFNMSNGTISENKATTGGGIYVGSNRKVNITGDSYIVNNTATGNGGGIYVTINGTLNLTDTNYITDNTAGNYGGGIYTANTNYSNTNTDASTVFNGNRASMAYNPPKNATILYPNIGFVSTSIANHPLNNYDINYIGTPLVFNVTYDSNGGTGLYTGPDIQPGGTDTVLSLIDTGISYTGHISIEWNTQPDGSGDSYRTGDSIILNDNVTLYAQWTISEYTVTFESNGGTPVDSQRVPYSGTMTKPIDPTKSDYIFGGWYTDDETFLNEWDFNTPVTEDLTLYAKWRAFAEEYTVTFESNGGTPVNSQTVSSGETATRPTDPTRLGYTFEGWFTDDETFLNEWDFNTPVTEDLTLYAKWRALAEEYIVTFESNGGTHVDSQTVPSGGTAIRSTDPTKSGYTFEGWYTDDGIFENKWDFNTPITENITLYAKWKEEPNCKPCNCKCIWMLMIIILIILIVFFKKIKKCIKYLICKIKKFIRCVICKCKCKKCKK